jgi:small subunit ribosomal protein S8
MSVSDPVADFLTGIRNALRAKHRKVDVPSSGIKAELAKVLLRERYINNFKLIDDQRQGVLRVYLKYGPDERPVISGLRRMSTPGRRVYVTKDSIPKVMGGMGTSIVSTSKGVMTDREAREAGLGGELVCQVW